MDDAATYLQVLSQHSRKDTGKKNETPQSV